MTDDRRLADALAKLAQQQLPPVVAEMRAGGASVKQVQTVLGHSSAVITLRVYSHMWPGDEDRTRSIVDATLCVLRTGCGPGDLGVAPIAGQGG